MLGIINELSVNWLCEVYNMSEKDNFEKRDNEEFNLYTENIVQKRSVKYKRVIHFGKLIFEAVIFGGIACITFIVLYQWLSNQFTQESIKTEISIPKDAYPDESQNETEENSTDKILTQDYDISYKVLSKMMNEAKKSIVTVTANYNDTEDFLNSNKAIGETSGLIFGETDKKYIILTSYDVVKNAKSISVVFNDGNTTIPAYLLRGDMDTGIAVIYVSFNDESDKEMINVKVAKLDNSYSVNQGDFVVAAGKLMENNSSVNYGTTININTNESGIDSYYSIICTSIQQCSGDYAYLFNTNGNVIGIMKKDSLDNKNGVIYAYGISDLKALIEKMTNTQGITYLGITGINITGSLAVTYSLPIGIYITQVAENSPAFAAGIQQGDIITMVNSNTVLTFKALSEKLYNNKSGDAIVITAKRQQGKDEYKDINFSVTLDER